MTEETRVAAVVNLRRIACETMGKVMQSSNLDLVLSNSDTTLVHYASSAG
jgi:hypothetical protein